MSDLGVFCLLNDPRPRRDREGGVMRYTRRVAEGLAEAWGERLACFSPERLAPGSAARWIRSPLRPAARLVPIHDWRLPGVARRLGARVVWSPYFGKVAAGVPEVFTVHDLTFFALARKGGWHGWLEEQVRREQADCFRRGAKLIAVSEATAQDLRARFPEVPADRVVVIHHGVDATFLAPLEARPQGAVRPIFLFVGHRGGYKNFLRLLEAWRVAGLGAEAELRVTAPAGGPWTPAEVAAIARAGLGSAARLVVATSDEALREEYRQATALVYPSAREGFGLPLLEAMASGTLVICANATCLPEVGGAVPFYHAPDSAEELAARLQEVLDLPAAERSRRRQAGRARAETFTWASTVAKTKAVLEQAAG